MKTIYPCIWFGDRAEEAANFYLSIFPGSKLIEASRYGPGMHMPEGTFLYGRVMLGDNEFGLLNGGMEVPASQLVSLFVNAEGQEEVDRLWNGLLEGGGKELNCGWVLDRYGVHWQIVPTEFTQMMSSPDKAAAARATAAMLKMVKLDLAALRKAFRGE